jgi:hypothetical protein
VIRTLIGAGPASECLSVILAEERVAKLLDKIIVIDLESTCWEGPPPEGQVSEIIEIGVVTLDVASLERVEKQSILIKPVKSQISEFCTKLTTLTPEHFNSAARSRTRRRFSRSNSSHRIGCGRAGAITIVVSSSACAKSSASAIRSASVI